MPLGTRRARAASSLKVTRDFRSIQTLLREQAPSRGGPGSARACVSQLHPATSPTADYERCRLCLGLRAESGLKKSVPVRARDDSPAHGTLVCVKLDHV